MSKALSKIIRERTYVGEDGNDHCVFCDAHIPQKYAKDSENQHLPDCIQQEAFEEFVEIITVLRQIGNGSMDLWPPKNREFNFLGGHQAKEMAYKLYLKVRGETTYESNQKTT